MERSQWWRRLPPALALCAWLSMEARAEAPAPLHFVETRHRARAHIVEGNVRLIVRRTIVNRSTSQRTLSVSVPLPGAAVIDRFRIDTGDGWRVGKVMAADAAQEAYRALIIEGKPPRRQAASPALLVSTREDGAELSVELVRAGASVSFELEILAPSCYADGRLAIAYPFEPPVAELRTIEPTVSGRGITVANDDDAELPDERHELSQRACHGSHAPGTESLIVSFAAPGRAAARWGTVAVGARELARFELELPTVLATVPRRATVVIVVDGSHSLADDNLDGQLALAEALVSQLPRARVQLVVFRRSAQTLLPGFVDASELATAIARIAPSLRVPGNGSNLDAGLSLAATLVDGRRGPVRIVAITDARMRRDFDSAKVNLAQRALPASAVVHLVDFVPSDAPLVEATAFDHDLEPLARAHGGTVVSISGETTSVSDNRRVIRHLVVPTRIDQLVLEAGEVIELDAQAVTLGSGYRGFGIAAAAPPRVRLRGWLWGVPWMLVAKRDESYSDLASRLAIGDRWAAALEDDELAALALETGTLSELTSMLASSGARITSDLSIGGGGYGSGST